MAIVWLQNLDKDHDERGNYLNPENKEIFKRFEQQKMLFWKFKLCLYDLTGADTVFLPIHTKGRPSPPEILGGHEPSVYYAMDVKQHDRSKAVILPMNIGGLYYLQGYEQHKNILLDIIDYVFPEAGQLVKAKAHERVGVILRHYSRNVPENIGQKAADGMILYLVNLAGFIGNT